MPKIPAIDDFRFGKTVNENKTLGTTGLAEKTNIVNYNIKIDINSKYVFEQCFPNKVIIANFRNLTLNFRYLKLI